MKHFEMKREFPGNGKLHQNQNYQNEELIKSVYPLKMIFFDLAGYKINPTNFGSH